MDFMSILYVDLFKGSIESAADKQETGFDLTLALAKENPDSIIFTAIPEEAYSIRGALCMTFCFHSYLTGKDEAGFVNSKLGFILRNFGYTAMVVSGRSQRLSYISFRGDGIEICQCENLRGTSHEDFAASVKRQADDVVISTGVAADNLVLIAGLYERSRQIWRGGFGYSFAIHNLKGMCFQGYIGKRTESDDGKHYMKKLTSSPCCNMLRRKGAVSYIKKASSDGFLPVDNWTRRSDPRAIFLDGTYLKEKFGLYTESCMDCYVSCLRRIKDRGLAPDLIDSMHLGSLQGIFSSLTVYEMKRTVYSLGLEVVETGSILASKGFDDADAARNYLYSLAKGRNAEDLRLGFRIGGLAPLVDYRGCQEAAVFAMLGEISSPLYSMYSRMRIRRTDIAAMLALFERAYNYALASRGLPITGFFAAYVATLNPVVFFCPPLLFKCMTTGKRFGIEAKTLLRQGLEIISRLDAVRNRIPDHFIYDLDGGSESVNPTRLMGFYDHYLSKLERKLLKDNGRRKSK